MFRDRKATRVRLIADGADDSLINMTSSVVKLLGFSVTADEEYDIVLVFADTRAELDSISDSAMPREAVVLLSASVDVTEQAKTLGFSALKRPYSIEELEAQLLAMTADCKEKHRALTVDTDKCTAAMGENKIKLTPLEAKLLAALSAAGDEPSSRVALAQLLGGAAASNKLDVHISALRRKLRESFGIEIVTIRGEGWKLRC